MFLFLFFFQFFSFSFLGFCIFHFPRYFSCLHRQFLFHFTQKKTAETWHTRFGSSFFFPTFCPSQPLTTSTLKPFDFLWSLHIEFSLGKNTQHESQWVSFWVYLQSSRPAGEKTSHIRACANDLGRPSASPRQRPELFWQLSKGGPELSVLSRRREGTRPRRHPQRG